MLSSVPITAVRAELSAALPRDVTIGDGYPNPFNATVRIPFELAGDGAVEMYVYDLLGRRVRGLVSGPLGPGGYSATWDGTDGTGQTVANGTYFVRLLSNDDRSMTKIMLLK